MNYEELAYEVRHWKEHATEAEKENCPACGIARYWLARRRPRNLRVAECTDPFHVVEARNQGNVHSFLAAMLLRDERERRRQEMKKQGF